jgi:septum formation protein
MLRLGSNSKTRAKILTDFKIPFKQTSGTFDEEKIKTKDPKSFVYEATNGKYNEIYNQYGIKEYPLLVADSVVKSNNILFRKPKNINEAKNMLQIYNNNKLSILTCMIYHSIKIKLIDISITSYWLKKFDKKDLEYYIYSNNCMGKAGAVEVEGFFKPYIKKSIGYESNAMGLCVEKLIPFL